MAPVTIQLQATVRPWMKAYGAVMGRCPWLFWPLVWIVGKDRAIAAMMWPVLRFGVRVRIV